MRLFGRGSEEEKEHRQFTHELVSQRTAAKTQARQLGSKDLLDSLGRAYYLQEDENVVRILTQYCPELLPAFSRMNATSKIEKPRDREKLELQFEDVLLHQEMELGDEGDIATRSLIKSLRINAEYRILDAMGGYRGRLVTEEIERTTHVIEEPKKKRFW